MDQTIVFILSLVGAVLGIVVLAAHFRLFSIDRSLKHILAELQLQRRNATKVEDGDSDTSIREIISGKGGKP